MTKNSDKRVFYGLDSLRGYASISVLMFHTSGIFGIPWLFQSGYLAVDIFFMMSGYVIAHSYEHRIAERGWRWFMAVRIARFLPLYVLGGLLGLLRIGALIAVGSDTRGWVSATIAYLAFLPAPPSPFSAGSISPLNGPAWSLLFELYVNLVFAVTLPWLTNRRLSVFLVFSGLTLLALGLFGFNLGGPHLRDFHLGLLRSCFSIGAGVMLYRVRDRIPACQVHPLALAVVVLLALQVPLSIAWELFFVLVASPLILVVSAAERHESWFSRYGAAASFAIYAVHQPLLSFSSGIASRLGLPAALCGTSVVVMCLVFAPTLDRHYDRRLRKILNRWLSAISKSQGAAPR